MIWMTWRQHRSAVAVGAVVFAVLAGALVWLGATARSSARRYGLASCVRSGTDCTAAIGHLQHQYHWVPPVAASLFALPLLAGMFWGAPLVAREIETGTFRLAWTQSVSRLRWISSKLALALTATAVATAAFSLLAVWAFQPLIPVLGNRFRGGWFDAQGIVPAAYTVFALTLGIAMGALWRKTIPAMAATMIGFAIVRIPIHNLRRHLIAANAKTIAAVADTRLAQRPWPAGLGPGDWVLSRTPTGAPTSGPPTNGPPAATYHYIPAARFWTLQGIEAAIFLALSAALIALCITVVTRSRPH